MTILQLLRNRQPVIMTPSLKGTFTPSKPKDTTNEQRTRNTTTIILRSPNLYGLRSYSGLHSNSTVGG